MTKIVKSISIILILALFFTFLPLNELKTSYAVDTVSSVVTLDSGTILSSYVRMVVLPDGRFFVSAYDKIVEFTASGNQGRSITFPEPLVYINTILYNEINNKVYVIGEASNDDRKIYVIDPNTVTIAHHYSHTDSNSSWSAWGFTPNGDLILWERDKRSDGDRYYRWHKLTTTYSSYYGNLSPSELKLYANELTFLKHSSSYLVGSYDVYKYAAPSTSGYTYGSVFYDSDDGRIYSIGLDNNDNIAVGTDNGYFIKLSSSGTVLGSKRWSFGSADITKIIDRPDGSWFIGNMNSGQFQIITPSMGLGNTFTINSFNIVNVVPGPDGSIYVYGYDTSIGKGLQYVKIYNSGYSTPTVSSATTSSVTLSNLKYDGKSLSNNILQISDDGVNFTDVKTFSGASVTFNPGGKSFFYARIAYKVDHGYRMYSPKITVAIPPTVPTGLKISSSGGLSWDKTRGRGYVVLNWNAVSGATGYKVHVFDGYQYRAFDVGNTTTWDSRVWKIYPSESWLNSKANNSITTDSFNKVKGGLDLADNPNLLYKKTAGSTYDSKTNYWFRVSAYNTGAESPRSGAAMITLPNRTDSIAPTGSIIINNGDLKTGSSKVKVKVSATDTGGSGIKYFRLSQDGEIWGPYHNYTTSEIDYTLIPGTGARDVYAQFKDTAGNESIVYKASIYVKDDLSGPVVDMKINNDEEYTWSNNVKLNIFATDDLTPIDRLLFRFSNDGMSWTSWQNWSSVGFLKDYTLPSVSLKELQSVFMQVKDESGNITTAGDSIMHYKNEATYKDERKDEVIQDSLNTDIESPEIKTLELVGKASAVTGSTVNISLVATDNVTTKSKLKVYYSFNGTTFTSLGTYKPIFSIVVSGSGSKTLYIKVVDEMGNEEIGVITFFKL